ncbi:M23 family metallopeptidase [Arthrobacter sp. CDRTa11]|uniref:M23 family metallopeptidase n=1 Tax=Arthrobacter sp. CDRTa11 TaxID=2651199 RepID=UPI002265D1FD|nr:M23 family metallopeptidase [Arthrobacter sp. CDRTa11]UZX02500.1 M23 family metallopeptidase [Arthrobacter sp. CDRTa11]
MKAPALLAALLLLPASVAPSGEVLSTGGITSGAQSPELRQGSDPGAARPSWAWPLAPKPSVLRPFDPPDKPWMSGHRGVDLAAIHDGAELTSPAPGTVSFVGVVVDRPVITIDHGNGLRSSFEPVQSDLATGTVVARGQLIGTLLPGHCRSGPCVHWGVRQGDEYVNPLQFVMDLRPSVLLPRSGAP